MDRCMAQEKPMDRLKERSKAVKTEQNELKALWEVQVKKLDVTRKALEETEAQVEALKKVFKDKEGEISLLRNQVFPAKEDGKTKFRNSDAFLFELSDYFPDGFNDCFCQVKASFLDLDLSWISIDAMAQTLARSVKSEDTDELFDVASTPNAQGNRKPVLQDEQAKSIKDETRPLEEAKTNEKEKVADKGTPADQPQFFFFFFLSIVRNFQDNNIYAIFNIAQCLQALDVNICLSQAFYPLYIFLHSSLYLLV